MKSIPFIILLALLLGCKCDKPKNHEQNFSANDHKYFPIDFREGSYWVYRNTYSNTIDTMYLQNYKLIETMVGANSAYDCCSDDKNVDCGIYKLIRFRLHSDNLLLNYYFSIYSGELFFNTSNLLVKPAKYIGQHEGFYGNYNKNMIKKQINIQKHSFSTYILLDKQPNNLFSDSTIIIPEIGFARIQYRDSFNLELLNYHLVK